MSELPSYAQQLLEPRWKALRARIIVRDLKQCRRCGKRDVLFNCHHRYYIRGKLAWEYPDEAFLTLCSECHELSEMELEFFDVGFRSYFLPEELGKIGFLVSQARHDPSLLEDFIAAVKRRGRKDGNLWE